MGVDHSKPTALYRLFEASGRLLYVGVACDLRQRMEGHAREKPWWPEVARKTAAWYDCRAKAETAEMLAIAVEKPLYNKTGHYDPEPAEPFEVDELCAVTPHRPGDIPGGVFAAASGQPKCMQVAASLRALIGQAQYPVGSRLPAIVDIARTYSVSPGTAVRATELLCSEGLIEKAQGRGCFVTSAASTPSVPTRLTRAMADVARRLDAVEVLLRVSERSVHDREVLVRASGARSVWLGARD